MARMNLDWVVGWWTDTGPATFNNGSVVLPLISAANLAAYEDDLVVERVVGQYCLRQSVTGSQAGIIHTRLAVRPEDATGVLFTPDSALFGNAEEAFLWHKVHYLEAGAQTLDARVHPEWGHIDCKVNRRLQAFDRLVFVIDPADDIFEESDSPNYQYAAWIRVLVRH